MTTIELKGTKRVPAGAKAAKDARKNEMVLCNLYGGTENVSFEAPYNDFSKIIYSPNFFAVAIEVEGKTYRAIVKEVQFHPVTDKIEHIDFLQLIDGKKIKAQIPIKLTGSAEGVKAGGKLIQKVRKLSIKATPEFLVDTFEVSVDHLEMGKSVKVGDLKFDGIEILNSPSIPICTITVPRAMKGATADAAKADAKAPAKAAAKK